MKKSTRKIISYLRRYIGHKIIRTKPAECNGYRSCIYEPILLVGFTSDGCIRCLNGLEKEETLASWFTDRNWITYKKARRAKNNKLNQWRGKKIRRIKPTVNGDRSYMSEGSTLISASKHYIIIISNVTGDEIILNQHFAKSEDWVLAE